MAEYNFEVNIKSEEAAERLKEVLSWDTRIQHQDDSRVEPVPVRSGF